jgi:hypothetical protein
MSDERFANIVFFIACIGLPVKHPDCPKLLVLVQPGFNKDKPGICAYKDNSGACFQAD